MEALSLNHPNRVGFASTCWTTVRACCGIDPASVRAREELCRDYWYPVYAHIKGSGHHEQDAADLTQAFFADILGRAWFDRVDSSKGRFRSFLLTSVNYFLRDHAKRKRALKRGDAYPHVSLAGSEEHLQVEQTSEASVGPAAIYEVEWASAIASRALNRLEIEYLNSGKEMIYEQLKVFMSMAGEYASYEHVAELLGISVENVKVSVHRMRKRYGSLLREEVARTVDSEQDIEEEMGHMRTFLTSL